MTTGQPDRTSQAGSRSTRAAAPLLPAASDSRPRLDSVRRWEIGGFKSSGVGEDNGAAFTRSFVYFTGWEGGRGPTDCEPLQVDFARAPGAPVQSYAAYATYSFRDCFCL